MKLLKFFLAATVLVFFVLFPKIYPIKSVSADTDYCDQSSYDASKCQSQINDYQNKLNDAKNQENTLKSQLDLIDGQTKITLLKIEDTNQQIDKLNREITDLSGRITRISGTLDSLSELLLQRIVQTYKYSSITPLDLIFSSHGFGDLLERLKYIQVVQAYDKKKLYELQATKLAYNDQKTDKQTRQAEQEQLQKQLDDYKQQLDGQKAAKAALLRATQNSEAVYQTKLQAALAEQQAILQLAGNAVNEVSDGPVHKGDLIGHYIMGASACSSGSHLHFEVHQNDNIVSPAGLLASHSVSWDNAPDGPFSFTGSWDLWPLQDPITIAQGFGMTYWARAGWYGGGPHTGIDMYSTSNSVVAVHDGTLYHGGIPCGRGTLFYKRIDHGDGYSSYYLHVI